MSNDVCRYLGEILYIQTRNDHCGKLRQIILINKRLSQGSYPAFSQGDKRTTGEEHRKRHFALTTGTRRGGKF